MPHATAPTLRVLHTLKVRGFAEPPAIAESTGLAEAEVEPIVTTLGAEGLATHRDGRISGWTLSADGKAEHLRLLAEDRDAAGADGALELAYKGFLDANERFKVLCTDWQLRPVGGELVVNDHTDAAYDTAIAARLEALHAGIVPVLDDLTAALPRFEPYARRLSTAATRFSGGEAHALARPLSDSYHDVWMELHQDLLLSLGRERSASDGD
jgi:hypothetical protein